MKQYRYRVEYRDGGEEEFVYFLETYRPELSVITDAMEINKFQRNVKSATLLEEIEM